jgi:flagellar FliJ protein
MKNFRYRLQALLKVREHIERERQKQLAFSTQKVLDQKNELVSIDQTRTTTMDNQRERSNKPFCVAEMLVVSRYLQKLKRDTLVGEELLKVLKKDEEAKRRQLLEAARERKKYEKLKERQRERFMKEFEQASAKESDEIAITTYRYKKKK